VITNRHARHTVLNTLVLNYQNQLTTFAVAFFPAFRRRTTAPPLTVLVWQNTLNVEKTTAQ
jgi:hypothetical protein